MVSTHTGIVRGLRHLVNREVLLPLCKHRSDRVKKERDVIRKPMKYLAMLNDSPLDVLYLHHRELLPPNQAADFGTVTFLARDAAVAASAASYLRQAFTIAGPFVETVLAPITQVADGTGAGSAALQLAANRQLFERLAPFDFLNLDFASTPLCAPELDPVRLLGALARVAELQSAAPAERDLVDTFSLCLAVRVPSLAVPPSFELPMREVVDSNVDSHTELAAMWEARQGVSWPTMGSVNWSESFCISWPKLVISQFAASGWQLDPNTIVRVVRYALSGSDQVLVVGMDFMHQRAMSISQRAGSAMRYLEAMHLLFGEELPLLRAADVTAAVTSELARVESIARRLSIRAV